MRRQTQPVLLILVVLLLAGCATGGATKQIISEDSVISEGVPFATVRIADRVFTSHGPQSQHYAQLDQDGMIIFSDLPAGAAHIGPTGVALSNPTDAGAELIEMKFVTVTNADGIEEQQIESIKLVGFYANISPVINADAARWGKMVEMFGELERTDREQFQALMDTIQSVAPGIVEAIVQGIKGF